METFSILYVEHDLEDASHYRQAMASASSKDITVKVETISSPKDGSIAKAITTNHFDLVVTDANFLPEGCSHFDEGDGEYLLDLVISEVRNIDKRVKIAVLSEFSSRFLSDPKRSYDLDKADYLWDKGKDDFVKWQVTRLMNEVSRAHPENSLINKIIQLAEMSPTMPWRHHIVTMVSKYKTAFGETEQVDAIFDDLKAIASEIGVSSPFSTAFKILMEGEQLNIAGKPKAWGHLRHALNVFWLGYYLLNNGVFDKDLFAEKLFHDRSRRNDVDACWFLASLFHDIGKVGETSDEIVTNYNKILKKFPGQPIQLGVTGKDVQNATLNEAITEIQSLSGPHFAKVFEEVKNSNLIYDHGMLSAIYIHKSFEPSEIVNKATIGVAFHNFVGNAKGKISPKFNFDLHPILALLTLCDQIEVWERETGLASLYSSIPIESTELLSITQDGVKDILFTINYLPFRYILPGTPLMSRIQRDLGSIITESVMPALDKIEMGSTGSRVGIYFKLDGRITLDVWPSSSITS